MSPRTSVGVIGVGLMGEVYARRLVAAGFTVIGCDVDPAKTARLAQFGVQAGTLPDIAQKCAPIVIAVFNTEQVEDVVERVLIPAAAGKIVLVTSTCDPDRIAALGARVGDTLRFLETPVSGTSEQVRQGDGVGLIGGDPKIAADAAPVLDALFAKSFHIGKIGDGGRAKLAVNLILGLNRLALAEGLVFAARLGLDPAAFLDVARGSAAISRPRAASARRSRTPSSCSIRRARPASNGRFCKFTPTCSSLASATATASGTTASSSRKSAAAFCNRGFPTVARVTRLLRGGGR